jgi:hypothetical protein
MTSALAGVSVAAGEYTGPSPRKKRGTQDDTNMVRAEEMFLAR